MRASRLRAVETLPDTPDRSRLSPRRTRPALTPGAAGISGKSLVRITWSRIHPRPHSVHHPREALFRPGDEPERRVRPAIAESTHPQCAGTRCAAHGPAKGGHS